MTNFFPTDVRLEVDGEYDEKTYGVARAQLFKTIQRAELTKAPTVTTVELPGGVVVSASIVDQIKKVEIYRKPVEEVPPELPEYEPPVFKPKTRGFPYMLSGWTKNAKVTSGVFNSFRPDPICAKAYGLQEVFGGTKKLGTAVPPPQARVSPSMFSGRMKRYVEASLGLGEISDQAVGGVPFKRTIPVPYNYTFYKTHGIVKYADKKFWLVEISDSNGLLVRPLPLIPSTTLAGFRSRMLVKGDYDTVRVLDEFGGLPSGEAFPTGTELDNAIAAGAIKQLLTKDQLKPFYRDGIGYPYTFASGWAFSENGIEAHNTCWTICDPFTPNYDVVSLSYAQAPPDRDTSWDSHPVYYSYSYRVYQSVYTGEIKWFDLVGEHWKLVLSLDDPTSLAPVCSAALTRIHRGMFWRSLMSRMWVPTASAGETVDILEWVCNMGPPMWGDYAAVAMWIGDFSPYYSFRLPALGWGVFPWVFFDGDKLVRVKWSPGQGMSPSVPYPKIVDEFWTSDIDLRVPNFASSYVVGLADRTALVISAFCREAYQIRRCFGQDFVNAPVRYGDLYTHTKFPGKPPVVRHNSYTINYPVPDVDPEVTTGLNNAYFGGFLVNIFPPAQVGFATNGAQSEYLLYEKYNWTGRDAKYWDTGLRGDTWVTDTSGEAHASLGLPTDVTALHPQKVNWIGSTP